VVSEHLMSALQQPELALQRTMAVLTCMMFVFVKRNLQAYSQG